MQKWPVQQAKARFSELLKACVADGPQMISRRGIDVAVLVPANEWRRLKRAAQPSLKQLLLTDDARAELTYATRGDPHRRQPVAET
ncbi:MAG: prevent-host-death protein [Betaproteobacteria bacterium HGW-Betaproteobacteria-3]|jgi:prevent-host-death family protein|nr:MAG: prevent-host-death protein [Betaproteobacteria bacterium HGW-Betaproteobacteria-3]